MTNPLPTTNQAKAQAKLLRAQLAQNGQKITHANALERVAQQLGFRDWNSFNATVGTHPPATLAAGARVQGSYLSRPFEATVVSAEYLRPGWFRLTLDLDKAVDVVTFDSFSNLRKRIRGNIGPKGTSSEKTSDGEPQLRIDI